MPPPPYPIGQTSWLRLAYRGQWHPDCSPIEVVQLLSWVCFWIAETQYTYVENNCLRRLRHLRFPFALRHIFITLVFPAILPLIILVVFVHIFYFIPELSLLVPDTSILSPRCGRPRRAHCRIGCPPLYLLPR